MRVPESEMLNVALACWIRSIIVGIAFRRSSEETLPFAATLQPIRVLNCVTGFMSHDASEFVSCTAFDVEHLAALESNQPRMGEIEWNRKSRNAEWRKPFFRKPYIRANAESPAFECFIQRVNARLERGSLDRKAEVLNAKLKESFVGPGGPRKSSAQ